MESKVFCPICNSIFVEFSSYGLLNRKNAQCKICKTLERHRLLWLYINEKLILINNSIKLLHFAPEYALYKIFSNNINIEYFPCDLYPESFDFNEKISISKINVTDITFKDDYFDFIICSHVLQQVYDDSLAISELYRVTKKGGSVILQVPINYTTEKIHENSTIKIKKSYINKFSPNDQLRIYNNDFNIRLEKAGFIVREINALKTFSSNIIKNHGINYNETLFHCIK